MVVFAVTVVVVLVAVVVLVVLVVFTSCLSPLPLARWVSVFVCPGLVLCQLSWFWLSLS